MEPSPLCQRFQCWVRLSPALMEDGDVAIQTSGSASRWIPGAHTEFHTSLKHLPGGLSQQGHSSSSSWAEETEEKQERKELPLATPRDIMVSAALSSSATAHSQQAPGKNGKGDKQNISCGIKTWQAWGEESTATVAQQWWHSRAWGDSGLAPELGFLPSHESAASRTGKIKPSHARGVFPGLRGKWWGRP